VKPKHNKGPHVSSATPQQIEIYLQESAQPAPLTDSLTIVLPAKNEDAGLELILPEIRALFPEVEIVVVNDGSSDSTSQTCERHDTRLINHRYSIGNGAAIKTGARHALGNTLVLMDADGQHRPEDLKNLLTKYYEGYDMVVGARDGDSQSGKRRRIGNEIYNRLASWMTGHRIEDLTSGFRVVNTDKFKEFLHLLPNGFSYPTTITMAFFRSGYSVAYIPVKTNKRNGKSHIRLIRDGFRFLLIIFRIGTLYSPLKVFVPFSLFFFLSGLSNYIYTYATQGRFTNMSALLFISSVLVFLIGLISEQITNLLYSHSRH
jgi:glycosyltransferase involved in cell wall biosynthesis